MDNTDGTFLSPRWIPSGSGLFGGTRRRDQDKTFTQDEVAVHNTEDDCWVIIDSKVYDITDYISSHPGGSLILKRNAGKDATVGFHRAHHSRRATDLLSQYYLGILTRSSMSLNPFNKGNTNRRPQKRSKETQPNPPSS